MRLHRLKLINFRQHADTEIAFGPGVTAIIGPNGAGKTTLLEAIAWAIYGNPGARGPRDFIRRQNAPARSPVRVEVDFAVGAHEYRVVRGLYQAELFQDGGDRAVANSQQAVTARLIRLLGMTREEFFNTYFTNQKQLMVMGHMGPTERAKFLSQVLGYEKLRIAQEQLREARSRLRGEHAGLQHGLYDQATLERERDVARARQEAAHRRIREAQTAAERAAAELQTVGPAWSRAVELRESVLSLDGERRLAEQRVEEARREFIRLDHDLAEALAAQAALKAMEAELAAAAALREEQERLEREAQAAGQRRALSGQAREVDSQMERLRERVIEVGDVAAALAAAEAELAAAQEASHAAQLEEERVRTAWMRERQYADAKRQALRDQYRDLQSDRDRILEAGAHGACPTCQRPLGDEFETVLATLARQLEEIELNGRYFRQRVDQLTTEPDEVSAAATGAAAARARAEEGVRGLARARERIRAREELEGELNGLAERRAAIGREVVTLPDRYDMDRHEAVRAQLKQLEPRLAVAAELRVKAQGAARFVAEAEAADRTLTERETHLKQLTAALADMGFSEEQYAASRAAYEAAEAAVRQADLHLATVRGDARAAEAALTAAEDRLAERAARAERVAALKRELRIHDEADRAFHELRTDLNAQMRPEISAIASSFLSHLTEGRYAELELDEEYRLTVLEDGVAKPVISGGEEDLANLALRLAISQMVADRAGQPFSLLVLDEVFGSLDETRGEQVLELLHQLGDRFPQVVLMTHVDPIGEGVDRVLRVQFDPEPGIARVIEDTGVPAGEDVAA